MLRKSFGFALVPNLGVITEDVMKSLTGLEFPE